jgi:hypothetical protein
MSYLSAFTTQLVNFFDELCTTFPEEKEIKWAAEGIKGAKKINPRLVLDLFREHVYKECAEAIFEKDADFIRDVVRQKFTTQFNEMSYVLTIFDKHWDTMGQNNRNVIWQYLIVLCQLSDKSINS